VSSFLIPQFLFIYYEDRTQGTLKQTRNTCRPNTKQSCKLTDSL